MVLLAVTADTWIVTGLGFGIVLLLLFFLIYVMKFFGWTMQKIQEPKKPKAESQEQKAEPVEEKKTVIAEDPKPVQALPEDDTAAIAVALYLASRNTNHDAPTGMIAIQARETAWNTKSIGLNNIGF